MPTDPSKQHIDTNKNVYVTAMPEWKQALWRDISLAAKAKNAFEDDDYDKNGDLDSNFTKFAEICTWLVCLSHFHAPFQGTAERAATYCTDEHVGRLHVVLKLNLRHSGPPGVTFLTATVGS